MNLRQQQTRRDALKTGAAIASSHLFPAVVIAQSQQTPPSEQLDTAVIGVGERGKHLIADLPAAFRVRALCDCSQSHIDAIKMPPKRLAGKLDRFLSRDLKECRVYRDFREMLDQQSFDAVIVATPDHHHAQAAMLALRAGAHVYVEKPLTVTIAEGRSMVQAAAHSNRVVQVGSQQRTMQINRRACEFIRDGGLGKISLVEERNFPGPIPYDQLKPPAGGPAPKDLDWDLFCGPTPLRPYSRRLWDKDAFDFGFLRWRAWDLFEDYSGHLMTNWGAHSVDMIQFALGKDDTGPVTVELRKGDIDEFVDDQWHQKTPPLGTLANSRIDRLRFCPLVMDYADGTQVQFNSGMRSTVFHGEKGKLFMSRNHYRTVPSGLLPPPDPKEKAKWRGEGYVARPHLQNWLGAIRSQDSLNAPVEVGHRTATICHLANLARRLDRKLHWDPHRERFVDDENANRLLSRPRRQGFELPTV